MIGAIDSYRTVMIESRNASFAYSAMLGSQWPSCETPGAEVLRREQVSFD